MKTLLFTNLKFKKKLIQNTEQIIRRRWRRNLSIVGLSCICTQLTRDLHCQFTNTHIPKFVATGNNDIEIFLVYFN